MDHFHAANAIRRQALPFDRAEVERARRRAHRPFHPEFFARHSAMGHDDETPVLDRGHATLRDDPARARRLESSAVSGDAASSTFWSDHGPTVGRLPSPSGSRKSPAGYERAILRMLRHGDARRLRATDKMPFNFFWVGLVHLLLPNARFVHSRRDPVDTCLSIYTTPSCKLGIYQRPGRPGSRTTGSICASSITGAASSRPIPISRRRLRGPRRRPGEDRTAAHRVPRARLGSRVPAPGGQPRRR